MGAANLPRTRPVRPMGAAAADRDAQEAALKARIARIESAQNSKILGLEDVPANPDVRCLPVSGQGSQ
jgi:hypothetical protein